MGLTDWLSTGKKILSALTGWPALTESEAYVPQGSPKPRPVEPAAKAGNVAGGDGRWVADGRKLTPHISLLEMTRTDHADLQEENRRVTDDEVARLTDTARLVEVCREILGTAIDVHSGKRGAALNARVGGSDKSQHLRCEACDFSPAGPDTEQSIEAAFTLLWEAARGGKLRGFGQLIVENQATGRERRSYWLHISLGSPHRNPARCGEVLRMVNGNYSLVGKV